MLIRQETLKEIAAGRVTLAFRRWKRPSVRPGARLRTSVGVLAIEAVEPARLKEISREDARQAGFESRAKLVGALQRGKPGQLYRIRLRYVGADPRIALREDHALTAEDVAAIGQELDDLDRRSRRPPWTREILHAIDKSPGTLAEDMAAGFGRTKPAFKADVRKLKELGLTISLSPGYELSPRGRAFLAAERHNSS
jgi:hypothetical protein